MRAFVLPSCGHPGRFPLISGSSSSSFCDELSKRGGLAARVPLRRRTRPCALDMTAQVGGSGAEDDLLASPDFVKRIKGINEVRRRHATAADVVDALLPVAASDKNAQVRYMAISQLAGLDAVEVSVEDGKRVLDTCLTMLREDTDPSCQAGAADAVAGLKLQGGFDCLVETFNSTTDWMLRFTIAAGIGFMKHPRSFEFLKAVLDSARPEGDELLIAATIGALADVGNVEALPIIDKYKDHPDASVKERANMAREVLLKV
jgi:hypothetical protein